VPVFRHRTGIPVRVQQLRLLFNSFWPDWGFLAILVTPLSISDSDRVIFYFILGVPLQNAVLFCQLNR
jgi:hypothetical protein